MAGPQVLARKASTNMLAPATDSITFIPGPFGCQIPRFPPHYAYVYLLHLDRPFKHAKHYLGFSMNLEARLQCHRNGNGARFMEVVSQAGIGFTLARLWRCDTWEEGRALERKLKKQHSPLLCPLCNPRRKVDPLVSLREGHW